MPTNLLGVIVPDYNGQGIETCHEFTRNFLRIRDEHLNGYQTAAAAGLDSIHFLLDYLNEGENEYQLRNIEDQIQPGDIICLGIGLDQANGVLLHSMIAIDEANWFGTNNVGTFGLLFQRANIVPATLPQRRAINLNVLGINGESAFNVNTYMLERPENEDDLVVRVYHVVHH